MTDFRSRTHPEQRIDGFTALDGTVRFYNFVRAIMLKLDAGEVLDFGAGRGSFWHDVSSVYRRHLRDLRSSGARVTACDVDEAVLSHPCSDRQVVIEAEGPLPFAEATFDIIVSDMTFEHIKDASGVAAEMLRILKPGGYICARTPNRFGYVRLMAGIIPSRLHAATIRRVQPAREAEDVFPTYYQLNSPRQVRNAFPGCNVHYFYDSAEPAYYFGRRSLYAALLLLHKLMPARLATTMCLFIKKPAP